MSGMLLPKMLEQLEAGLLGHVQISDDDAIPAVLTERGYLREGLEEVRPQDRQY